MRDIVLTAVIVGALPFAVRHTWIGVMLWTWISIMNPHRLTWGFAFDMPFAAMAAGAALLSLFVTKDELRLPWEPPVVTLLLFVVWMCVTTLLAIYPEASLRDLNRVLKIQLMTFVAFAALRDRKHIELFVWINVISIGYFGVKGGLFTIAAGGVSKVWGPPGGFIEGNNELGLAIIMVIPLMNYLRVVSSNGLVRATLLVSMLLCAAAALGTHSRGALLAIVAMALVLWSRAQRKAAGAVVMVVTGVLLVSFMPQNWDERMSTISTYEQDSSATGRLNAWEMAFNLANDRPIGGGFSIITGELFARYAPNPNAIHAAHSIYFQVLGEHGYPGLILFLLLGWFTFRTAGRIRAHASSNPDTAWLHPLAGMIQVSLVGYAVGGAFLSLAYFDLPYNVIVILVVCRRWLDEGRWKTETRGAFGATVPVDRLPSKAARGGAPR